MEASLPLLRSTEAPSAQRTDRHNSEGSDAQRTHTVWTVSWHRLKTRTILRLGDGKGLLTVESFLPSVWAKACNHVPLLLYNMSCNVGPSLWNKCPMYFHCGTRVFCSITVAYRCLCSISVSCSGTKVASVVSLWDTGVFVPSKMHNSLILQPGDSDI